MAVVGETRVDDDTKARVVEMYKAGATAREITDETGVVSSTIYWILDQAGVPRLRTARRRSSGVILDSVDLTSLEDSGDEVTAFATMVRYQLEQMRVQLQAMESQLQAFERLLEHLMQRRRVD